MPVNTDFPEQPNVPVSPTSFTGNAPQVIAGNTGSDMFPTLGTHLTTAELAREGTNWVKVLLITALLLLLLDGVVYGYNIFRGVANPDLLAPINSLIGR